MRLEALAVYLQSQGHGTQGIDIFVDFIPDDVKLGTMLRSGLMATAIDYNLPNYRAKERFQLIVRSTNYPDGYARIADATAKLTIDDPFDPSTLPAGTVIGDFRFNFNRPRHEPLVYPLSVGNLIEFSVNFDCNYVIL